MNLLSVAGFLILVWLEMKGILAQTRCPEEEKSRLLHFKNSLVYMEGYSTKISTWNESEDCCTWRGVTCNTDGEAVALDMGNEFIFGFLSVYINLPHLQSLNLSHNMFYGQQIPSAFLHLSGLRYLNLAFSNLTGSIDESIASLQNLEELHLEGNSFKTQVPLFFANFSSIKSLFLGNSFWVGEFPSDIFRIPSLQALNVEGNFGLSGKLPEFNRNSSIKTLKLSRTMFGGIIPESIGNLNLETFTVNECQFEGEIPRSLFNISTLVDLQIRKNFVKGTVELDWIQNLPNLKMLSLSGIKVKVNTISIDRLRSLELYYCNLTEFPVLGSQSMLTNLVLDGNNLQDLPSELPVSLITLQLTGNNFSSGSLDSLVGNLTSLDDFDFSDNGFVGKLPSSLCNAVQLRRMLFWNNNFYGSIPDCYFSDLTSVIYIILGSNFLSGTIPDQFPESCRLKTLNVRSNMVEGELPRSLKNCADLTWLFVDNNKVRDAFPCYLNDAIQLRILNLSNNFFFGDIKCVGDWPSLTAMDLSTNGFDGFTVSLEDFGTLSSLKTLNIQKNKFNGTFPLSICSAIHLQTLYMAYNNFHGNLPDCLFGNLTSATSIDLRFNNFDGKIPETFPDNCRVNELKLSNNNFEGPIPKSLGKCDGLRSVELENNKMADTFPCHLKNATNLMILQLSNNLLYGDLTCIGNWPFLMILDVGMNRFTSFAVPAEEASSYFLVALSIASNMFNQTFPSALCNFLNLVLLGIENNNFHGAIPGCIFEKLKSMIFMNLDSNHFDGEIPDKFRQDCKLQRLYLMGNMLEGPLPKSIQNCQELVFLDLSKNNLRDSFKSNLSFPSSLHSLNLANNLLYGDLRFNGNWSNLQMLDLSSNYFTSSTLFNDESTIEGLNSIFYLNLANNSLAGDLPASLCSIATLEQIDLSHNDFRGEIHECFYTNLTSLRVLNLRRNLLSGSIKDRFHTSCVLQSMMLDNNQLEGPIPRSITKCKALEVLDVKSNQMNDSFPCHLKNMPSLRILSLRNNSFFGMIQCSASEKDWAYLRVMDLSINNFSGVIPSNWFATWEAITRENNETTFTGLGYSAVHKKSIPFSMFHQIIDLAMDSINYYENTVAVTAKGQEMLLGKMLGIVTAIDFSQNHFHGPIPQSIGLLSALYALNLSYNAFTDEIPSSFGNFSHLESLDLSNNHLSGHIPLQLAQLRFLQQLNLSNNKLEGKIPTSTQLQSFPASSYNGNKGLYGPPLADDCPTDGTLCEDLSLRQRKMKHVSWFLESGFLGFGTGLSLLFLPIVFAKSWRIRYNILIEYVVIKLTG